MIHFVKQIELTQSKVSNSCILSLLSVESFSEAHGNYYSYLVFRNTIESFISP
jgi:hypothetical protein